MLNTIDQDLIAKIPTSNPYNKVKLEKVVIDLTLSSKSTEKNVIPLLHTLAYFTGQYPSIKTAKKSVASFKLRKGTDIGVLNTLRRQKLDTFVKIFSLVCLPHLAASQPGLESITYYNRSLSFWTPSYMTPNLSLGIKDFYNSFGSVFLDHFDNLPFKKYSGGANIQFIFNNKYDISKSSLSNLLNSTPKINKHFNIHGYTANKFILSSMLFPLTKH